ncbi:holo-ACP synthase [Enterobacteriaceae endosymbiont of Donacia provostii]|uniref:holo-ACP synthase n=1 Tax=Enterobacteriaceae endosymbiont of Donacia provostii TaxID=2675781 RepID=UPI0014497488|nr:holo-ACP synthase [Enterobacteriaceae endosymbiont of Donacia provostii]QJC33651.1 holo-ACP synthase [Enterobacteriaceae endosymbiont of Donacia provostii]
MNIFGIGIDIIEIKRIQKVFMYFGNYFAYKILTKNELFIYKKSKNKIKILSKYFTAKEATVKALGTGFTNGICFNQIEILNFKNNKPKIILYKHALNFLKNMNFKYKIHISFSDEKKYACTIVIIEKK